MVFRLRPHLAILYSVKDMLLYIRVMAIDVKISTFFSDYFKFVVTKICGLQKGAYMLVAIIISAQHEYADVKCCVM